MLAFSHYDKMPEPNHLKKEERLFWLKFDPWSVCYVVLGSMGHTRWMGVCGRMNCLLGRKNKGSKDSNILPDVHPNSLTSSIKPHLLKPPYSPSASIRWGCPFISTFGRHLRSNQDKTKYYLVSEAIWG